LALGTLLSASAGKADLMAVLSSDALAYRKVAKKMKALLDCLRVRQASKVPTQRVVTCALACDGNLADGECSLAADVHLHKPQQVS
jgi:hypothetical protein